MTVSFSRRTLLHWVSRLVS